MKWKYTEQAKAIAIKIEANEDKKIAGWAYLYVLYSDRHDEPYGFLENLYVEKKYRGRGFGTELVQRVIEEARKQGCYKLIGTTRYAKREVHAFYQHLGFKNFGIEFRMDLAKSKVKQSD
ncbi:MAG: hypothetical protein A3B74_01735 [Candidatus Kerfeldbacteria bacterium RIFCSPHIGHO2_02_FULL_42_14]|uniref:N-acetyltransferase domain-containing protein n=1 Tax=Candidatus Kerfeldbacteria bacterium RIFCSPHIGHO2_02_FULL_42_14 TaxID=1798540 RepID=A0A1G2ATC3_9BACT|nr:MAG: hypothetical protein A3B74_01735 [Candidatus Kerfeldbacteria bacterium RIFCSPHIGHO2_02_FULL_42_14]OGY82234.1 MAG: hypothetical protein A3E60_00065 [Candidatus Kerfeldbacteria bacterium RIFCSPHIGHO2_12_FULL_42_13]OGY82709.1 MAG: hypothetical protein A3I91_00955 [Candidatus Kerfeldbacteria bacterium RIFCSPLOWO2_02_FULL_42_19]OGY87807.1 MAG: hypothetical protein A3G01_05160 [Candidatus Kerfeldbacteria bacterium RIFCSPLOWO2_12_FULL_43_9]